MEQRETVSVAKVSEILNLSGKTVRKLIATRELEAYKTGRGWNVYRDSLDDYIQKNSNLQ